MYRAKSTAAEQEETAREEAAEVKRAERDVTDNAGSNSSEEDSFVIKIKNLKRGNKYEKVFSSFYRRKYGDGFACGGLHFYAFGKSGCSLYRYL